MEATKINHSCNLFCDIICSSEQWWLSHHAEFVFGFCGCVNDRTDQSVPEKFSGGCRQGLMTEVRDLMVLFFMACLCSRPLQTANHFFPQSEVILTLVTLPEQKSYYEIFEVSCKHTFKTLWEFLLYCSSPYARRNQKFHNILVCTSLWYIYSVTEAIQVVKGTNCGW